MEVTGYNRDVGKHGDTAVGEVEVIKALALGLVDAGLVSGLCVCVLCVCVCVCVCLCLCLCLCVCLCV